MFNWKLHIFQEYSILCPSPFSWKFVITMLHGSHLDIASKIWCKLWNSTCVSGYHRGLWMHVYVWGRFLKVTPNDLLTKMFVSCTWSSGLCWVCVLIYGTKDCFTSARGNSSKIKQQPSFWGIPPILKFLYINSRMKWQKKKKWVQRIGFGNRSLLLSRSRVLVMCWRPDGQWVKLGNPCLYAYILIFHSKNGNG